MSYYDAVGPRAVEAGLCETCRWRRDVPAAASVFVMCRRGLNDPTFPKYPVLPVRRCRGYEQASSDDSGSEGPR